MCPAGSASSPGSPWLIAGVVCLIILNGDLPAVLEIKENEKTERKRVSAAEDIAHRHYDLAEKSEEHRHLETMAHIHADQRLADLQDRMRAIYDMVPQLTLDQQALPKTGSFTVQRGFPPVKPWPTTCSASTGGTGQAIA